MPSFPVHNTGAGHTLCISIRQGLCTLAPSGVVAIRRQIDLPLGLWPLHLFTATEKPPMHNSRCRIKAQTFLKLRITYIESQVFFIFQIFLRKKPLFLGFTDTSPPAVHPHKFTPNKFSPVKITPIQLHPHTTSPSTSSPPIQVHPQTSSPPLQVHP